MEGVVMEKEFSDARDFLNKDVKVVVDRPLGSNHPKHGFLYESNYGYIPNTLSPDGEELDVYLLGVNTPVEEGFGRVVAIIHRTNDDDDKLIVLSNMSDISDEEIRLKTDFQEKYFKSEIIR